MPKKSTFERSLRDIPDYETFDIDERAILTIRHKKTAQVVRSWGWSLSEVLEVLGWKADDVWAVFNRPWKKTQGASNMTPGFGSVLPLEKLNPGEKE